MDFFPASVLAERDRHGCKRTVCRWTCSCSLVMCTTVLTSLKSVLFSKERALFQNVVSQREIKGLETEAGCCSLSRNFPGMFAILTSSRIFHCLAKWFLWQRRGERRSHSLINRVGSLDATLDTALQLWSGSLSSQMRSCWFCLKGPIRSLVCAFSWPSFQGYTWNHHTIVEHLHIRFICSAYCQLNSCLSIPLQTIKKQKMINVTPFTQFKWFWGKLILLKNCRGSRSSKLKTHSAKIPPHLMYICEFLGNTKYAKRIVPHTTFCM